MSLIKVDIGGKGVGLADQASIDLAKGCTNNCKGCYAQKTSRLGHRFGTLDIKEYNDVEFRKSCRTAVAKGIGVARLGKHTDCGLPELHGRLSNVLSAASAEGLRLVFVTKSLRYDVEICRLIKEGNHIIHYSFGMITDAPSERERHANLIEYEANGVNVKRRIIEDVTKPFVIAGYLSCNTIDKCIVTPMRYPSKDVALILYGADLSKYKFVGGFYRPIEIHESWKVFKHWCGEVGDKVYCCNCLINGATNGK